MALNFPSSPTIGQIYTDSVSGFSYEWNGTVWISFSAASSSQIKPLDDISGSFDDVTQTFALTSNSFSITPPTAQSLIINLGGVIQDATDDYSVTSSNITFSTPPASGLSFSGVSLGPAIPVDYANDGNVYTRTTFTATASQTTFTVTGSYTVGYLDVYQNGVRLSAGTDYTATNGTTFVLTTPAILNDEIESIGYKVATVVTTIGEFNNLNVLGISTFTNGPVFIGAATGTGTATQRLQVTGGAYVSGNLGVGIINPASNTQVAIAGTLGISEVGLPGTRTLFTSGTSGFTLNHNDNSQITFQTLGVNRLTYSHSSNFWNIPSGTPFLIGTGTSTGTANQLLRVEGGAYVSGNLGLGITNPTSKLHIVGDALVTGVSTFSGSITGNVTGNATGLSGTPNITVGIVTASEFRKTGGTATQVLMADGSVKAHPGVGANFNTIPLVGGDGVMEIGRYIDFHATNADATDLTYRFDNTSNGNMSFSGNLSVSSALSKGSGSFKIDHPLEELSETHHLVHSFIEGPKADLIYRGKTTLISGISTINIDEVSDMTNGTFVALCREVQCFTTNETGWTAIKGSVTGNLLTIQAQDLNCTDKISWMVIGERKDKHMYETEWTNDDGKVIVEPLKKIEINT